MMDLVIVFLLLLGSAYFAGTELAVTMASRVRLRALSEAGSRMALMAGGLLLHRDRAIVVCLVGNNLVNVGIAVYARKMIVELHPMSEALADTVTTVLVVPLVLLFGEIIPKAVSQNYPNRVLRFAAGPLLVVRVVLAPLLGLALLVAELVRLLSGQRGQLLGFASREDLKQFVARSERRGHVDADERDLIHKIFEFWKLDPVALVRPLSSVTSLTATASVGEAKELMRAQGLSRLVLVDASGREVTGVVTASRLLSVRNDARLASLATAPLRLEPAIGLDALFAELQREPSQLAFVRQPDGETGVLLLDDLLHQLLGHPAMRASRAASASPPEQPRARQKRP